MQEILSPFLWIFTLVYIDDIVVYSKTFEDHLNHVDLVLKAIADSGLTFSPPKCHLGYQSIVVLGNIVSRLAQHGWSAISCLFLDGLQLIYDNYPSSIPVFYNVLDTVRIFLGYGKINSVRLDFLEYPIQYKKVGYCWGNCHESTIIYPRTSMK